MRWSGQFLQFVQCSAHRVLHAVGHIDIFVQVVVLRVVQKRVDT